MESNKKNSVATQPSYGQRFVKRFPSKHKDPKRAEGQMRGLADLIDFIIPQTKSQVAIEALSLVGLPKPVRKVMSKAFKSLAPKYKDSVLKTFNDGQMFTGDFFKERAKMPEFSNMVNSYMFDTADKLSQNKAKSFFSNIVSGSYQVDAAVPNPTKLEMALNNRFAVADEVEKFSKIDKKTPEKFLRGLGVHESTHMLSRGNERMGAIADYIYGVQKKSFGSSGLPLPRGYIFEEGKYGVLDPNMQKYVANPTETYARLMEIRHDLGLHPKDTNVILNAKTLLTENRAYSELRTVYDAESIQDMMKNLPAVVAVDMKLNEKKDSN